MVSIAPWRHFNPSKSIKGIKSINRSVIPQGSRE
jgi:hypothetical protein